MVSPEPKDMLLGLLPCLPGEVGLGFVGSKTWDIES